MKRHHRHEDGTYHINGQKYELLEGSRAQVWHGTAHKTAGGLIKSQLLKNKHGRIVSKKKHNTAKREKRLQKHGYTAKKGKFGAVKINKSKSRKSSQRSSRKNRSRSQRGGMSCGQKGGSSCGSH